MRKTGRKLLGIMLAASLAITSAFPMQGVAAAKNDSEYQSAEEVQQPTGNAAGGEQLAGNAAGGEQLTGNAAGGTRTGSMPEVPEGGQQPEHVGQPAEGAEGVQQPDGEGQCPEGTKDSQQPAGTEPGKEQQPAGYNQGQEPAEESQPAEGQEPAGASQWQQPAEEGQQPAEGSSQSQQPAEEGQPAEGQGDSQQGTGGEQPKEDTKPPQAEPTEGDRQPSGGTDSPQESTQPGDGTDSPRESAQPANGAEPSGESTQPSEEGPSGSARQQAFMLPQSDGGGETGSLDGDGSYDINQPVIESFELEENGQTLTTDQSLHFKMHVFDSDSKVKSVSVRVYGYYYYDLEFEPSGEENVYTATVPCSQFRADSYYVGSIRVEDERDNYIDGTVTGEDGEYLYRFTIQNKPEEGKIALSGFKMELNASNGDGTLKAGDSVTYTANVQCEGVEAQSGKMSVTYGGTYANEEYFDAAYDKESGTISGTFVVREKTYPEKWCLWSIDIVTTSGRTFYLTAKDFEPEAELEFTVNQAYDKDPPVIESIDVENGLEAKAGDTVEIRIKVKEDHPSDIAQARFDPPALSGQSGQYVMFRYQPDTGEYVCQIQITDLTYPCKWQMGYLSMSDTYGNKANLSDFKGDGQEDCARYYTVSPEGYDTVRPAITKISIDPDWRDVKRGDTVTLKVEAEEKNPDGGYAYFALAGTENPYMEHVSLSYSSYEKAYVGSMEIQASTEPGQWELTELSIRDKNQNTATLSDYEEQGPWGFTVDESGYDVNGPVIESITIDKNGEFVRPGDTLGIKIKVNEKNPDCNAYAYFYPQVANVSSSIRADLVYVHAEKAYVGSIPITDSTYPCEWALTRLEMEDTLRYSYSMSEELSNWQTTYPWYFKVKSGNTYREDVKNAEFSFYGLQQQENGGYGFGYSNHSLENVGRRATLKELGIFPAPIEGVTATWTRSWGGLEIKEDTELLLDSYNYFSAAYDKGCANVSLTYISEESGEKTVIIPVFADKEATYKDVLAAMELPEDAKTDDFAEIILSYSDSSHNWNTKVGEITNISAIADYKNCQVTWNARYIGQDGKETSKAITGSCKEGTTAAEALAELERPEDAMGMEGEGWALLSADEGQVLSKEMVSFDIVALYRGKTTVDVSYTYRSEDGTIAGGSKLLALEGEDLSEPEIQGEATDAFKDASHFPGLRLSEWAGTVGISQGKYKKIQFQAQYYNCVVALKYPDETCQYAIVEKNTEFTLPTENETYTDILWEGFGQGQTVTITEDREFLAAEAKRKDGTEEKPEGERLTAEEITKIKEEIEKAETGATVKIDMKKATVVPKEVLEAIKGKPVDIVLDMGSYSWNIAGAEVNATGLKDIDLEVAIGTDKVPSALVSSIAEGKPATQLSLTHNGDFGFRADLTLNLGSENSGSYGNLYYYDSSGKLIFRNAGQIGSDGSTTLSFSHASDYVAVVDKAMHTGAGTGGETADGTGADKDTAGETGGTGNETAGDAGNGTAGGTGNETAGGTGNGTASGTGNTGTAEEPGNGENGEPAGTGSKEETSGSEEGNTEKDNMDPREQEEKEPGERPRKDAGKGSGDSLTATIKKNTASVTADSGSAGSASTDTSSFKSPKTGE